MKSYDVLILGSGISALTSALLLAKRGKRVGVVEQYVKPGGYMHGFKRFDETFDTGAHYVGAMGEGQPFRVLLEYLGVYRDDLFVPLEPAGYDVLHFPRGPLNMARGYAQVISELNSAFPAHRPAIEKYFTLIREISARFPTYRYHVESESFPPQALELSLREVVDGLTGHEPLKSVFFAYCTLHGVRPEDVAFGFHAIITDSLIEGPYGLNGGGDALTASFVKAIEACGGEVMTGHRVTEIAVGPDRQVECVRTHNGGEFRAPWVISSLHPKATFRLLKGPDLFPPVFKERVKNLRESDGIFGLYAVCLERPLPSPAQNHFFFRSDDSRAIFAATNPDERPPIVFMSSPKRRWRPDERNFPISLHSVAPFEWFAPFRAENYGRRSAAYKELKQTVGRSVLGAVDRYWTGFSGRLRDYVTSTPLSNLHFNGSEEGSAYGIYHSMQVTGPRALGPRTKVLNLLLTGQSCLFPGLMGGAISGLRSAGHIIGVKQILRDLQGDQ
jgi:all-trans-retinol 13,14-reductase